MAAFTRLEPAADAAATLRAAGLSPYPWSSAAMTVFAPHSHGSTKHLYVVRGSIEFDGLKLNAGEGILIPAGTTHSAVAGPSGVTCVEAFEN